MAVYGSQQDLLKQLARASIPVYSYRHAGLADVNRDDPRRSATASGTRREAHGDRHGRSTRSSPRIRAARRQRGPGRGPCWSSGGEIGALRGIYASGGIGFLHDMLEAAGGEDVFADVKRESVQATTELILARKPEVILEIRPGAGEAGIVDVGDGVWRALASVPAVRNGRVHFIVDPGRSSRGRASAKRPSCWRGRCTQRRSSSYDRTGLQRSRDRDADGEPDPDYPGL